MLTYHTLPLSSSAGSCAAVPEVALAVGCPDFVRQWEGQGTYDEAALERLSLTGIRVGERCYHIRGIRVTLKTMKS